MIFPDNILHVKHGHTHTKCELHYLQGIFLPLIVLLRGRGPAKFNEFKCEMTLVLTQHN